ncbi:MAG: DUF2232 domain-containing protein [bacterium]|nr:DUF2232 domain-containing protein [bacterium]
MNSIFMKLLLIPGLAAGAAYLFYKWEWKALFYVGPGILLSLVLMGMPGLLPDFLAPIAIGAIGGVTFKTGKSVKFFILAVTISVTCIYTGDYYFLKQVHNTDIANNTRIEMINFLPEVKAFAAEWFTKLKVSPEGLNDAQTGIDKFGTMLKDENSFKVYLSILPFGFFIQSLFNAFIGYFILRFFFSRVVKSPSREGLEFFKLNDYCIFAVIIGWGLVLLLDKAEYSTINIIGLNAALIVSVFYVIQAMGIVKFFLIKKGAPSYLLPMLFLFTVLLGGGAILVSAVVLAGLGTLDLWADFRKLEQQVETPE